MFSALQRCHQSADQNQKNIRLISSVIINHLLNDSTRKIIDANIIHVISYRINVSASMIKTYLWHTVSD